MTSQHLADMTVIPKISVSYEAGDSSDDLCSDLQPER